MPIKKLVPLPESLRHLQPFVLALAKLSPDELNEDVDPSLLDSILRKRIKGLKEGMATEILLMDRNRLEQWLKTAASDHHPGYWILGYLSSPDLAASLTGPAAPLPRGPKMVFDPPKGWSVKTIPYRLEMKRGKLIAVITAIDESTLSDMQLNMKRSLGVRPPMVGTCRSEDIHCGEVCGKKYTFQMVAPTRWKDVHYLLKVPEGFVHARLCAMGAEFDEAPVETKLHTLRLSI